jgi:two-component system OmpR family response regulator
LHYDPNARQLFDGQTALEIPRREMSVFECLLSADGRLVSKSAVLDHVYGVGADIEEKVVEVYISRLRHKLKDYGVLIQARRGLGYHILAQEST